MVTLDTKSNKINMEIVVKQRAKKSIVVLYKVSLSALVLYTLLWELSK